MNCIYCGKNAYELKEVFQTSDKINAFGRRELAYSAHIQENLHWKEDFKFHCDNCGASFTFKEATLQKPIAKQPEGLEKFILSVKKESPEKKGGLTLE